MSQTSTRPTPFDKPITPETLPELFAHHRRQFGGWGMTQAAAENEPGDQGTTPPARPDGVSEEEWNALGDPGRTAIIREREARQTAERALAAARARPAAPAKKKTEPGKTGGDNAQHDQGGGDHQPDMAKLISDAVNAAVKPLLDRDEQREADTAVEKITTAVMDAAKGKLHDPTDALANIDLTLVTDGNGRADAGKIDEQLKDLLTRKPHLGKPVDDRLHATPGHGATAGGANTPLDDRVKATLAQMQASTGLQSPASN